MGVACSDYWSVVSFVFLSVPEKETDAPLTSSYSINTSEGHDSTCFFILYDMNGLQENPANLIGSGKVSLQDTRSSFQDCWLLQTSRVQNMHRLSGKKFVVEPTHFPT